MKHAEGDLVPVPNSGHNIRSTKTRIETSGTCFWGDTRTGHNIRSTKTRIETQREIYHNAFAYSHNIRSTKTRIETWLVYPE